MKGSLKTLSIILHYKPLSFPTALGVKQSCFIDGKINPLKRGVADQWTNRTKQHANKQAKKIIMAIGVSGTDRNYFWRVLHNNKTAIFFPNQQKCAKICMI